MSLRHTLKSLIAGPQTQTTSGSNGSSTSGGTSYNPNYNYNYDSSLSQQPHHAPGPHGYAPQAPVHNVPGAAYSHPQGPPTSSTGHPVQYGGFPQTQTQAQPQYIPPAPTLQYAYSQPYTSPPPQPHAAYGMPSSQHPLQSHQLLNPAPYASPPHLQQHQSYSQAQPSAQPQAAYQQPQQQVYHQEKLQVQGIPQSTIQVQYHPQLDFNPPPPPYSQATPASVSSTGQTQQQAPIANVAQLNPPPVPSATHPNNQKPPTHPIVPKHNQPTMVTPPTPRTSDNSQSSNAPSTQVSTSSPYVSPQYVPYKKPPTPSLPPQNLVTSPILPLPGSYPISPPFSPTGAIAASSTLKFGHSHSPSMTSPIPVASYSSMVQAGSVNIHPQNAGSRVTDALYQPFAPNQQTQASSNASQSPSNGTPTKAPSPSHVSQPYSHIPSPPIGIIHPSMLIQQTSAASITTAQIPSLPTSHTQPSSANVETPFSSASMPPRQPQYPGHKPSKSVSRSLTFSKKNADGSPNWDGILITIDGMPSETFNRLVDGIYNFAGGCNDPDGLSPDQIRVLFERLGLEDQNNHPKRLALVAQKLQHPDILSFVNTNMIQFYTIFNYTYITGPNLTPLITREGFNQYMITDVLIDPTGMHARYNQLLTRFGREIIDPSTQKAFGNVQIQRASYPPAPNDQCVSRHKKQTEAMLEREAAILNNDHDNSKTGSNNQGGNWGFHSQGSWGT